jgi:trans-aconitate 2-methyltransferase
MDILTKNWYNNFASSQIKTSINLRHYKIINYLHKEGLNQRSTVLEIGCGVGTLTKLIAKSCTKGLIKATDISDESIKYAKTFLKNYKNVDYQVTNMSDFISDIKFDIIVLADVLEHIPKSYHSTLFSTISNHMHKNSALIIHIPHFKLIEFLKENQPEKLQIIDQPISPLDLISVAEKNNLMLTKYEAYGLFSKDIDYVFATFRNFQQYNNNDLPNYLIVIKKFILRLLFFMKSNF